MGLTDQQDALALYLEALLGEPSQPMPAPVIVIAQAPEPAVAPQPEPAAVPFVAPKPRVPTSSMQDFLEAFLPPGEADDVAAPDWALEPFLALVFKVDGLSLGLPVKRVEAIQKWEANPEDTNLPTWQAGVYSDDAGQSKIVDTAHILQAGPGETDGMRGRYRYVVLVDDKRWGLACESVSKVITLDPAQVRWRPTAGSHGWLVGVTRAQDCALLDVEGLVRLFAEF